MGKNIQNQDNISLEYVNRGGCMRGFLQHINHSKWYHVKKKIPYKKHKSGSHLPVAGDPENVSITNASTEVEAKLDGVTATANSEILSKCPDYSSVHKSSMKSRIKALITEEVSKRRGKHRRCSSYPARLPLERSPSIHLSVKTISYSEEPSAVSNLLNPLLRNEANELGKHSVKDHALLQESLAYAVEQSKNSSHQDSKIFLDSLDLLNIRKEFFMKVVQDPRSSISHQLRRHKASVRKLRFNKSLSFPASGSSGRNRRSSTGENDQIMSHSDPDSSGLSRMPTGKYQVHESPQQMLVDTSLGATLEHKEHHSNKIVMKQFKKLREKVKQALKEKKSERYRIIMDSIMHKVPYGRGNAKANKQQVVMHPGTVTTKKYLKCRSANSLHSHHICPEEKQMRRTSSFNESLERYNQSSFIESLERYNRLLELCLGKEAQRASDSSRQRMCMLSSVGSSPVSLTRMHSLPDLRSYSLSRFEESPSSSDFPAEMISKTLLNVVLDTHINLETSYKHVTEESAAAGGTSGDTGKLKKPDNAISKFEVDASETCSTMFSADEDLERMFEGSSHYDEDFASLTHELRTCSPTSPENNISINIGEIQTKQTADNRLRIQVDTIIENEFNYVRDVLELSGFNGDEFFKKWDASEQPLDPSVYDEMEEFLLVHPESSGNNEGGDSWNHILLFDVINEVLLDMSRRSFSYWPVSLTYSCRAYRIPVGYHVLEEVWKNVSWHLGGEVELSSLDSSVSRDLSKDDGWMNLQFEVESLGLELEEWILDDLVDELFLGCPSFG